MSDIQTERSHPRSVLIGCDWQLITSHCTSFSHPARTDKLLVAAIVSHSDGLGHCVSCDTVYQMWKNKPERRLWWWMDKVTEHSWCRHTHIVSPCVALRLWHIKYVGWRRERVDALQWTHWAFIITLINLKPDPRTQTHTGGVVARSYVHLLWCFSFLVELRCLIQSQISGKLPTMFLWTYEIGRYLIAAEICTLR